MIRKFICECGYEGKLKWVKEIDEKEVRSTALGCPECKALLDSGKLKKVK